MLGWHINVYKQTDDGAEGTRVAVWQRGVGGLKWLDELAKAGKAINHGGNGYPCTYSATAEHVIPQIAKKPPGARNIWISEPGDILTEKWEGKTVIDRAAVAACRPDEWLLIEAWDES